MARFYSPLTRGFYDADFHEYIPADAVEISDAVHSAMMAGQELGKIITPGAGGYPELVDPPPSVITVTPWQIRKALNQLGLRASVEAAVAASSQEVKDGWEFASEFRSDNELIAQLCSALGKTEGERVALFQLAATL